MKKFLAIAALTVAPIAFAAPAHAQQCNQICRDEANDPGYQSALRGGNYYGGYNNYGPYSAPNSNTQQDMSCVQVLIFSRCKVKPRPMVCYDSYGNPIAVDEKGVRFVGGTESGRPVPRQVAMTCGGNTYEARQ